jgi:hypothetical protein
MTQRRCRCGTTGRKGIASLSLRRNGGFTSNLVRNLLLNCD